MSKTVFKTGDKVFCILRGHGVVIEIYPNISYSVRVTFDNGMKDEGYTCDGRYRADCNPTLSFTEYTISGFSQERLLELPEKGEEIMVSNNRDNWVIRKFVGFNPHDIHPVLCEGSYTFRFFKRLR